MSPLIWFGAAAVALLGDQARRYRRRTRRSRLALAARDLGLAVDEGPRLSGRMDGFRVDVTLIGAGRSASLTIRPTEPTSDRLPEDFELRKLMPNEQPARPGTVVTGDNAFDRLIRVRGREAEVLAVLDAPTRQRVLDSLPHLVVVDNGIECTVPVADLAKHVRSTHDLARRLVLRPSETAARLAGNARADPCLPARLRNLEVLVQAFPGRPETRQGLRVLRNDPSPEMRREATLARDRRSKSALGKDAASTLLEILATLDEAAAVETFDTLIKQGTPDQRWPLVDAGLSYSSRWVRSRALEHVVALGGRAALSRLDRLLADPDVGIAIAAARAIERHGDASCQAALLRALKRRDLAVREAVAQALGAVGTIKTVMALRDAAADPGVRLLAPAVHNALLAAIDQIQSRIIGADAGQISLAEDHSASGQVSLDEDEERASGALSLSDRQAHRQAKDRKGSTAAPRPRRSS